MRSHFREEGVSAVCLFKGTHSATEAYRSVLSRISMIILALSPTPTPDGQLHLAPAVERKAEVYQRPVSMIDVHSPRPVSVLFPDPANLRLNSSIVGGANAGERHREYRNPLRSTSATWFEPRHRQAHSGFISTACSTFFEGVEVGADVSDDVHRERPGSRDLARPDSGPASLTPKWPLIVPCV